MLESLHDQIQRLEREFNPGRGCTRPYSMPVNQRAPYITSEKNIRKLSGRQWESNPQPSKQLQPMTIPTSASAELEHQMLQGCLPARTADEPCVLADDLRVVFSLGPTVTVKGRLWCKNLVLGLRRSLHLRRRLCPHLPSIRVIFSSERGCTLFDIVSYISTASVQSNCASTPTLFLICT